MKDSIIALMGSLLACSALPSGLVLERQTQPANVSDIKAAVYSWRNDTGIISQFLNDAGSRSFTSQSAFHSAAVAAYDAELDEINHKQVLDDELPHTSRLERANATLVDRGTFNSVVALLYDLSSLHYLQKARIHQNVHQINFGHNGIGGRCGAVLPNIDVYFSEASDEILSLDGDDSLDGLQAVRPTACGTPE